MEKKLNEQNDKYMDTLEENETTSLDSMLARRILQKKSNEDRISQDPIEASPRTDFIMVDAVEEPSPSSTKKEEKVCTSTNTHEESSHSQAHANNNQSKAKQNQSFYKRYRSPILLASCMLIGGASGMGGSYIYASLNKDANSTVLYQSVQRTDSNGASLNTMSVKDVVANTSNSVVEISTESVSNDSFMQQAVQEGAGSGVIISNDGYIVTNNHVVEGANKITVRIKDGTTYEAKLIGADKKTDLAVIKVDGSGLQAAVMGSSTDLSVGDTAIAIGNPLGQLGGTVTQGIISALDREITVDNQAMTLLQTDTAISPGNSGGGLFDESGNLIGVVNAKSSGSSVEGLGFAIPIDTAKGVIESLIANGYVSGRPQLGVSMVNVENETTAFQAGVSELGVYVAKVNSDSAAEKAGLKVKDRILKVDDKEISSSSDISKIVDSKQVGDQITLIVQRDGNEKTITATLQEAPQEVSDSASNSQKSQQGNFSR